ncbi:ABC transporter permease [Marinivivus vitaminiproducens]|uniref:ABC transporter permease n=1 Tax=Marinivivus vitaminiproducens TaxID=3035935 RepID=UPI00279F05A6|nr:ABC transporter permease [Geminicoccaceae bacterium SCSIO 64248]
MAVAVSPSLPLQAADLRRSLRRTERRRTLRALALVLPLFLFLLVFFVLPIARMLFLSVDNGDMASVLPETASLLQEWDGEGTPGEAVFAAFGREIVVAQEERTLAEVATRLNFIDAGFRSLLFGTARKLPDEAPSDWREAFAEADPRWTEPATWQAIRTAAPRLTDFYLLQAVDLQRGPDGGITNVPPQQALYRDVLGRTFWISTIVTLVCLVLAYPLAYKLATLPPRTSNLLMILVLLPFWTSLLVRTTAWVVLLQREGLINQTLMKVNLIAEPLQLIYNRTGVYIAMVHILLPFMILPLYSVMKGISPSYMRAAVSLGATPFTAFRRVYLPQTTPGIAAGSVLVFILAIGYYITPALVGGAGDQMISSLIAFFTIQTVNWGLAAALGTVLMVATAILYAVYAKLVGVEGVRLG